MQDHYEKKWGPIAAIGIVLGIISIFVNGLFAILLAFFSVFAGFYALKKRHERLSAPSMLIGATVLMIINLYNLGIIPSKTKQDIAYLVHSIQGSIDVFNILKENGSTNKEKLLQNIRNSLREAKLVNLERMDRELPGFSAHYKDEFIAGLESLEQGYENNDAATSLQGGILLNRWSAWYNQRHNEFKRIRDMTPSPFQIVMAIFGAGWDAGAGSGQVN